MGEVVRKQDMEERQTSYVTVDKLLKLFLLLSSFASKYWED